MSHSIRFLSYNTHLFAQGGVGGLVLPTYRDRQRADLIAKVLLRSGADVIGLSEVWPDALADRIAGRMRPAYHAYRPPPSLGIKLQTSGLLLLSRSPFVEGSCGFQPFSHLAFPDDQANKGVAWGRCRLRLEDRELRLLMFLTHTQADYTGAEHRWQRQKNIELVARYIDNERNPSDADEAVVLLGDLNVVAEDARGAQTSEYRQTREHLDGLRDAYRLAHPQAHEQPGYTYDGTSNTLVERFAPDEVSWRQRVDYHFVGGALVRGGALRAGIPSRGFTFRVAGQTENLSDHEPLSSTWESDD